MSVVGCANRQHRAGTRRVQQREHGWASAGTTGTRLTVDLQDKDGKECHEEGPPRVTGSGLSSRSYRRGGPFRCCTPDWISVASVSTSTCSTVRVRASRLAHHRPTRTDCAAVAGGAWLTVTRIW